MTQRAKIEAVCADRGGEDWCLGERRRAYVLVGSPEDWRTVLASATEAAPVERVLDHGRWGEAWRLTIDGAERWYLVSGHWHHAERTQTVPFTGPIPARHPNPAAHGGVEIRETCRCGAVRRMAINCGRCEYGPWHRTGGISEAPDAP